MPILQIAAAVLVVIACARSSRAQTSLYIPGFNPQPVSGDILGVGPGDRTTWALHEGRPTGTESAQSGFVGTATLVEGPDDASLTYANSEVGFTIGEVCTFSDGWAVCTIVAAESTQVQTEAMVSVPVQVSTPTLTPSGPSPPNSATHTTSALLSSASGEFGPSTSSNIPAASTSSARRGKTFTNYFMLSAFLLLAILI
ncbi:hypothetical protein AMATHDRAFT_2818 [Amanita thiersii Skay4041]|uniref:Uncharacterized protein n=1 Tax=Amanita thiersii Skay4041 TaxID=703135 RepID=A0A2A9NTW7_9AGAR|nr:hypothetical protein AMATHDRAFT_2818 [Amanita thiersii Skay4041]